MDKAERMRRTKNIIKKRWRILMSMRQPYGTETKEESQNMGKITPHYYHKFNLDCGCRACRGSKQYDKYHRPSHDSETKREIEEQLASFDIE